MSHRLAAVRQVPYLYHITGFDMRASGLQSFGNGARLYAKVTSSRALRGKGPLLSLEHVSGAFNRMALNSH